MALTFRRQPQFFKIPRSLPTPFARRIPEEIASDVVRLPNVMVNAYLIGPAGAAPGHWMLVDTGLASAERMILRAVERRFGEGSRPAAIVLTHGHFDHVGSVVRLARRWDVPVYAHTQELPYLTGGAAYPPPDPAVGGGLLARLSRLYPNGPIDLGDRVRPLPADGTIPKLDEWRWIHTPGHTAGHVSLFRDEDRLLIAGDAFVTVAQESAASVIHQTPQIHGPPAYFTTDWESARESVRRLADLEPAIAATGHGVAMRGEDLRRGLDELASSFDTLAVPPHGRYVSDPVHTDGDGVQYLRPSGRAPLRAIATGAAIVAIAAGSAALLKLAADRAGHR